MEAQATGGLKELIEGLVDRVPKTAGELNAHGAKKGFLLNDRHFPVVIALRQPHTGHANQPPQQQGVDSTNEGDLGLTIFDGGILLTRARSRQLRGLFFGPPRLSVLGARLARKNTPDHSP